MATQLTTNGITMPSGGTLGDSGSAAPLYMCRAWVNFTGAGPINGQGNVTSITRNVAGDYTVNFTTAMVDANYCIAWRSQPTSGDIIDVCNIHATTAPSTTSFRLINANQGDASSRDCVNGFCMVFR